MLKDKYGRQKYRPTKEDIQWARDTIRLLKNGGVLGIKDVQVLLNKVKKVKIIK